MFGSNDSQTVTLLYTLYSLLAGGFTAWIKIMRSIFEA